MQGKTVIITGADGDIGRNTTKGIAEKGPETIRYLGCADEVKEISGTIIIKDVGVVELALELPVS